MNKLQCPKILFITRKYPPSIGGMENFAKDLHETINTRCDVDLIKWGGGNIYLPIVYPWLIIITTYKLMTRKYDIIHAQDGLVSLYCAVLKKVFNKPLVVVIHGLDVTYHNKIYQWLIKRSLKEADKIVCISRAAAEEVIKRGIEKEKVKVITLGINKPEITTSQKDAISELEKAYKLKLKDKKIILSVGRLVKRKGVAWFVENVMPKILSRDANTLLLISGDGEDREKIIKILQEKELEKNVFLLGRTSDEVLGCLWGASDVFIMPNIKVDGDMEGFGIVLLEASSRGLPVVAAPIEGIIDATKENKNAIYIESENSGAWARGMNSLLEGRKKLELLGRNFKQYTQDNYSWAKIAEEYNKVYIDLS